MEEVKEIGQKLIDQNHYAADDIKSKLDSLKDERESLRDGLFLLFLYFSFNIYFLK